MAKCFGFFRMCSFKKRDTNEDDEDLLASKESNSSYVLEKAQEFMENKFEGESVGEVPSSEAKERDRTPSSNPPRMNCHFNFVPMELTEEELKQGPRSEEDDVSKIVGWKIPTKAMHVSKKSLAHWYRKFQPSKSDVIIATACKTGTTWLLQVCHTLRYQLRLNSLSTSLDFDDIYEVTPWHMMAWDLDQDIKHQKGLYPNIFKSHQLLSAEKRGAKYITTIREPIAVLKSWFKFQKQKGNPKVTKMTSVDEFWADPSFLRDTMNAFPGLMEYYTEAWLLRDNPNVLVVCYEDMLESIEAMLPTIASFLGLPTPLNRALVEKVLSDSSKQSMMKNASKYDESVTSSKLQKLARNQKSFKLTPSAHINKNKEAEKEMCLIPSEKTASEVNAYLEDSFRDISNGTVQQYLNLRADIKKAFKKKRFLYNFNRSSDKNSGDKSISPGVGTVTTIPISVPRQARRKKHRRKLPSKDFVYEDVESSDQSGSVAVAVTDDDFSGVYVHFLHSDQETSSEKMEFDQESNSFSKSTNQSSGRQSSSRGKPRSPKFAGSWAGPF